MEVVSSCVQQMSHCQECIYGGFHKWHWGLAGTLMYTFTNFSSQEKFFDFLCVEQQLNAPKLINNNIMQWSMVRSKV